MSDSIALTVIDSPLGPLRLTSDGAALTGLYMNHPATPPAGEVAWRHDPDAFPFRDVQAQLAEYFAGRRTRFDLPLAASGTSFQKRVWAEMASVPFGGTISYGELARRLGDANGARAVGLASGRNPISVVVPCHRVIGASGRLVGFGGGLERKSALLRFERAVCVEGAVPWERIVAAPAPPPLTLF